MRRIGRSIAIVLAVFCAGEATSAAQSSGDAPSSEDTALAKRHYILGEGLYKRSDYQGALRQFEQSYKLAQRPALLFNIARCLESLGRHEQAIQKYKAYLKSNPPEPETIRARIANLSRLVEAAKKADAHKPARAAAPVAKPKPKPAPIAVKPRDPGFPIVGVTLAAVGVAGLAAAGALWVMAASKSSDLEEAGFVGVEFADVQGDQDTIDTFNIGAIAAVSVGAVAAAIGTYMIVRRYTAPEEPVFPWFSLGPTAGGAAVTAGIQF